MRRQRSLAHGPALATAHGPGTWPVEPVADAAAGTELPAAAAVAVAAAAVAGWPPAGAAGAAVGTEPAGYPGTPGSGSREGAACCGWPGPGGAVCGCSTRQRPCRLWRGDRAEQWQ